MKSKINAKSTEKPNQSPWGFVQHAEQIAPGIWEVSTASHGGLKVSQQHLNAMPAYMRETSYSKGLWFEEDCDWALVAVFFPDAFRPFAVKAAFKTMEAFHKDSLGRMLNESPQHREFYAWFNQVPVEIETTWQSLQAAEVNGSLND